MEDRRRWAGAILILVAAGTFFVLLSPRWIVELLSGPADTAVSLRFWAGTTIVVWLATTVVLLLGHLEMYRRTKSDGGSFRPVAFTTEALGLIAGFAFWGLLLAFVVVPPDEHQVHVLDLAGRAGAFGSVMGLGIATCRGVWLYAVDVRYLAPGQRGVALGIFAIVAALFAYPTQVALGFLR